MKIEGSTKSEIASPPSTSGNRYWSERGLFISNVPQAGYKISSDSSEVLSTVLGSCVAVCARDPMLGIGGMNHFLLPAPADGKFGDVESEAMRYGTYAIERMINKLIASGAVRDRIEIKVFGGANMFDSSSKIGSRNAEFVEDYLKAEGFSLSSSDLRGNNARKVRYRPSTGEAWVKRLSRHDEAPFLLERHVDVTRKISEIELF